MKNHFIKLKLLFLIILFIGVFGLAKSSWAAPLTIHPTNPRYFTDGSGKAVYLTGSHTWDVLKDMSSTYPPTVFDYTGFLNLLQTKKHNFFRLWTWELTKYQCGTNPASYTEPWPWQRTGPGTAHDGLLKFDLNKFNQAYFDRLRSRVIAARDRGIYVAVMLFEGYGDQFCEKSLGGSPFDVHNNINGIDAYPTEPYTLNDSAIAAVQKLYINKVIDTVNDLDNVLYEIANEAGSYSVSWQYHMINYIKNYETGKPKKHLVGMTFPYKGALNSDLFNSPADWISPNPDGGYTTSPPANDGKKIIVSDTDHLWGIGGDRIWVWKSFVRGLHPIYMDDLATDATKEGARNAMGYTLTYANKMNLAAMAPTSSSSDCSTTYCLRNPGNEYLIYQPTSNTAFTVNLLAGAYSYEWFNSGTGSVAGAGNITVSAGSRSFTPAFSGDAVLYLKKNTVNTAPAAPTWVRVI